MNYETPGLTALTPAISAIQAPKETPNPEDSQHIPEVQSSAYDDWE